MVKKTRQTYVKITKIMAKTEHQITGPSSIDDTSPWLSV